VAGEREQIVEIGEGRVETSGLQTWICASMMTMVVSWRRAQAG